MSVVIDKSCDHGRRKISVALSRLNPNIERPREELVWIVVAESGIYALSAMRIAPPL
jgi:hypothetical protein